MGTKAARKQNKKLKLCILLLANAVVAYAIYNAGTAEKDTPFLQAIAGNTVSGFFKSESSKNCSTARARSTEKGLVTGILYSENNSSIVIDGQVLHEGDSIYGITIAKIHKDKVEFETANIERWTQRLHERPNPAFSTNTH